MRRKLNCWEFKLCGRERGGMMTATLGECPVSLAMQYDGVNNGKAAGRACWIVRKSGVSLNCPGLYSRTDCHQCEFYMRVMHEQEEHAERKYSSIED